MAAPSSAELLSGDGGGRVVWRLDGGKTVPICAWFSPDSRKLLCYDAPFDPLTSDLEDLERAVTRRELLATLVAWERLGVVKVTRGLGPRRRVFAAADAAGKKDEL